MPFDAWYHDHTLEVTEILHEPDLYALKRLLELAWEAGDQHGVETFIMAQQHSAGAEED